MSTLLGIARGEATPPEAHGPEFVLRFHWQVSKGFGHPEFTYLKKLDETSTVHTAGERLAKDFGDSLSLLAVHVQRPGETFWRSVG